jgi:TusA-related sulfurtransferase
MSEVLNLIGARCPEPEARSSAKIETLKTGDKLRILVDDKKSCESIPMVVKGSNCKILEFNRKQEEDKEIFEFVITKL